MLDLDETLVHSSFQPTENPDIKLPLMVEPIGQMNNMSIMTPQSSAYATKTTVYVQIRPGCHHFLREMAKTFNLVIFTASLSKYADPLITILDSEKYCQKRLFREHCTVCNNIFVKDLKLLGTSPKDTVIVENSPNSFAFQNENAVLVPSWYSDPNDQALYKLIPILNQLAYADDVRTALPKLMRDFRKSLKRHKSTKESQCSSRASRSKFWFVNS